MCDSERTRSRCCDDEVREYHSKLKQSQPFDEYRIVQHYSGGPLFRLPVLSAQTVIKVAVYRDSKPCHISHWCRDRRGVDSLLILIFDNTQALASRVLPALCALIDPASFSSVRPLGFYFSLDTPAIDQLRVAPALWSNRLQQSSEVVPEQK